MATTNATISISSNISSYPTTINKTMTMKKVLPVFNKMMTLRFGKKLKHKSIPSFQIKEDLLQIE